MTMKVVVPDTDPEPEDHDLDWSDAELDEWYGDERMAFVWCRVHCGYEWHWLSPVIGEA
jgi:hypothetical protein